jgi:hypothetical protein
MKKFVTILFLLASVSSAEACYTTKELEAEQGVRIHSELMVIGLTCLKMPQGQELYRKYQTFTQEHSALIGGYETDLINYYGSQGASNPEQKLNTLRTNLANEVSRRAISMSILNFCQRFSSRIDQALSMDESKLRRWARRVWSTQPPSEPVCGKI